MDKPVKRYYITYMPTFSIKKGCLVEIRMRGCIHTSPNRTNHIIYLGSIEVAPVVEQHA